VAAQRQQDRRPDRHGLIAGRFSALGVIAQYWLPFSYTIAIRRHRQAGCSMSIKHALVVDDSKSAQLALKKQLEQHHLLVSLADSGEDALEFLEHQSVDVIFMDHTMPGMDGLQALAAIKRNPRTATIPVMMYTTKEGEVYVGQARALGGLGVLSKEVHPQVLFDMLVRLGLVQDRRTSEVSPADAPRRRATDEPDDGAPSHERSPGIALTGLVNRIVEDQAALRAEIRKDRAALAREVAAEVIEAQRNARPPDLDQLTPPRTSGLVPLLTVLFAATTLIFAAVAWNATHPGTTPAAGQPGEDTALQTELDQLQVALHTQQVEARQRYLRAIDALQWALNQRAGIAFDELPFDDARAEDVRALLERLVALGFNGRVRIESHLGEFCLVNNDSGNYVLAPSDLPIEACTMVGHPLDNSTTVIERQSVGFAEFLRSSPLLNASAIRVELVAYDRAHSLARVPVPPDISTAGAWNRIAQQNNRLEFVLIPTGA
jgi:CheY-like chemotaxis protein